MAVAPFQGGGHHRSADPGLHSLRSFCPGLSCYGLSGRGQVDRGPIAIVIKRGSLAAKGAPPYAKNLRVKNEQKATKATKNSLRCLR
jgi:hypothetical protein